MMAGADSFDSSPRRPLLRADDLAAPRRDSVRFTCKRRTSGVGDDFRGSFSWVIAVLSIPICRSRFTREPAILFKSSFGNDGVVLAPGRAAIFYVTRVRVGCVPRHSRQDPVFGAMGRDYEKLMGC